MQWVSFCCNWMKKLKRPRCQLAYLWILEKQERDPSPSGVTFTAAAAHPVLSHARLGACGWALWITSNSAATVVISHPRRWSAIQSAEVQFVLRKETRKTHPISTMHAHKHRRGCFLLTLLAQSKQVVTTLLMTFIKFFVSRMTWSTFTNVAAFPTVGSFTVNCSVCTNVGTTSNWSSSSFFESPAGTWYEKMRTTLYKRFASSAKYSACVNRSCVVRRVPSPFVNWYMEMAMVDMFFARFTMSLFSSTAPFHLSVSASISLADIFTSRPALAIFSCSSWSKRTAFNGFDVVPCFCLKKWIWIQIENAVLLKSILILKTYARTRQGQVFPIWFRYCLHRFNDLFRYGCHVAR